MLVVGKQLQDIEHMNPSVRTGLHAGELQYDLAYAYYNLHETREAQALIASSLRTRERSANICSLYDQLNIDIQGLYAKLFPGPGKRLEDQCTNEYVNSQMKEYTKATAAMSADEARVYSAEAETKPCHTSSFDSRGLHEVTWWYCDAHGRYRKAYTYWDTNNKR